MTMRMRRRDATHYRSVRDIVGDAEAFPEAGITKEGIVAATASGGPHELTWRPPPAVVGTRRVWDDAAIASSTPCGGPGHGRAVGRS